MLLNHCQQQQQIGTNTSSSSPLMAAFLSFMNNI